MRAYSIALSSLVCTAVSIVANGQGTGHVQSCEDFRSQTIGFNAADQFGRSMTPIGDYDGDGYEDIVVGAQGDDAGGAGPGRGALWLLLLDADGSLRTGPGTHKFRMSQDTLPAGWLDLDDADQFGKATAAVGDLDSNGYVDLVVTAPRDDAAPPLTDSGAIYFLFMQDPDANAGQPVKSVQKFGATELLASPIALSLERKEEFGRSVIFLGDDHPDGVLELPSGLLATMMIQPRSQSMAPSM